MLDRLIRGARVFDGSRFLIDHHVGILGETIAYIGTGTPPARVVSRATGQILAPAFIDTHNHGDFHCLDPANDAHSARSQGVGTIVVGNCGYSATPKSRPSPILLAPPGAEGVDLRQHRDRLGARLPLDVVDLLGHNTLRLSASADVDRMSGILDEFLSGGGAGMSVGLNFADADGADERELLPLCKVLGKYGKPLACHIRGQGERLVESVEEVARLGEGGGCPVLVSHLRPVPARYDHLLQAVLDRIDRSPFLFADLYPYEAGCTTLDFFFRTNLGRVPERDRWLPADWVTDQVNIWFPRGFEDILVVQHRNPERLGKTAAEAMDLQRILLEDPECLCVFQNTSMPESVDRVLLHPKCFVGSDGYLFSSSFRGTCHPRSFGAITRFLVRYVKSGKLSLEDGLAKLTRLPAQFFNLRDCGEIRPGLRANLCLLRFDELQDRADFSRPWESSVGVTEVIVRGR